MASSRLEWTSVPRWTPPGLPAAASYLACWFGEEAERRVRALLADADSDVPVRAAAFADRWDDAAEAELRHLIGACRTGVRIILAGPESIVMRSAALAKGLGASDEELVPVAIEVATATNSEITARNQEANPDPDPHTDGYITGIAGRRVFCADCRSSFDAVAAIGGTVACPGCASELFVDRRFSRPHAAYFGWPAGLDLHQ